MRFANPALLLFFACWSVAPAHAVRFFVDPETGDDRRSIQSAQSETTPFRSISHAVKVAHLFDHGKPHVIDIASGTYSPSTTGEMFPIQISERGIFVHTDRANLDAEGRGKFFEITEEGIDFVLRNFTFVNGSAETGGVVSCQACTLRVAENLFVRNVAEIWGDLVYMNRGQLSFYNNIVRDNGEAGAGRGLVEIHNTAADTIRPDTIRNNTFHNNHSPAVTTSGGRVDISSNIFSTGVDPAIAEPSMLDTPLVRYNMFWNWDLLYVSGNADSIQVLKTVRDTLTLEEQGVSVPSFFTNEPDTVAQAGVEYEYVIGVEGDVDFYIFKARKTPLDASASLIEEERTIRFTPTVDDVGSHEVLVEIYPPGGGANEFLKYRIEVFTAENFPDLTDTGPQVEVSQVPDTTGAVAALNALVPGWAADEENVGGNLVDDPEFFNLRVLRFELKQTSPARDAGNPAAVMNDHYASGTGARNDMGRFGGPRTAGTPAPGEHTELVIITLPDSVVAVGQEFTYDPVFAPAQEVIHVDFNRGPTELTKMSGLPPHSWTPVEADTGKYLVEAQVYGHSGHSFHFFPLRVKPDNEPPTVISTPPTQVLEDSLLSYRIEAEDQDGDEVTFTLVTGPSGMVLDELGVLQWRPSQENVGREEIEVRVTDSEGASILHAFPLTVVNTNDPPVLSALPDTSILEDLPFRLVLGGFGSDVDHPADSLSFALSTAPDMASVDSLGNLMWTPLQEDVGVNPVTVHVMDPAGAADSSRFEITVIEVDDPPVISGTPETTAFEDSLYSYDLQAVDEEGARLTYEVAAGPEEMSISATGLLEWTPAAADTGEVEVTLNASDPAGQTATQSFTLDVDAVNDAPAIVRIPAASNVFPEPGTETTLKVRASDEEGDPIRFSWFVDGTEQAGEADSTFSFTPDAASTDTVVVQVADPQDTTTGVWFVDGRRIGRLRTIAEAVDFGRVAIGDTGSVIIDIVNEGHADLEISRLQVGDLAFSAGFGSSTVAVGDSTTLELRFVPATRGSAASTIAFATSDSDQAEISVAVSGIGIVQTTVAVDGDSSAGNQGVDAVSLEAGDRLAFEVYALETFRVMSYSLLLVFDPEVLEFVGFDASEASLLAAAGNTVQTSTSTPSSGQVLIRVAADPLVSPADGDGFLGGARFSVSSALTSGLETTVELSEVRLRSEGETASYVLEPALVVQASIGAAAAGDFDGDGDTDFTDFFLLADRFGTREGDPDFDSVFDLNGDGAVGLTDFFLFADHFAASAKPVADVYRADALGLRASLEPRPRDSEVVELALRWAGEDRLRGFVVGLEYDPQVLQLDDYVSPDRNEPLVWLQPGADGATVAVGLSGRHSPFENHDVGAILFLRLLPRESEIRLGSVLSYVGQANRRVVETAPPLPVAVSPLPAEIVLDAPFPNPFNPETAISFFLPESERVRVRVIDLLGRAVRVYEQQHSRGFHEWRWDGRDDTGLEVASGVYVIQVQIAGIDRMHKVTLLK